MGNDKTILELILDELKEMRKEQNDQGKTLAEQHISLQNHMKRSDNLEEMIGLVREEMKPLNTFKARIEGGLKFIGGIAVLVGVATGIVEIIQFLAK